MDFAIQLQKQLNFELYQRLETNLSTVSKER